MQCTCYRKQNEIPFYVASLRTVKICVRLWMRPQWKPSQVFPQANRPKPSGALFASGEMRSPVARVAESGPSTQPKPTAFIIWAAKGGHCSTFGRAATATGQSTDCQLSKSLPPCKTDSETTREGCTWVGKLPSSYIPKQEKVKVSQFRHLFLQCCSPASLKFPLLPFNKCVVCYPPDSLLGMF